MRSRTDRAAERTGLTVSVVVPTRDRPGRLGDLLGALRRQTFPTERFEVVVVNDGGAPIDDVVRPFRDALAITIVRCPRPSGCAGARQSGASRARGRLLVFTDDDCVPSSRWLASLEQAHRAQPDAALGGPVVNGRRQSMLAEALQLVVNRFTDVQRDRSGGRLFFPTNNVAFPAAEYRAVGGLDPVWRNAGGEDRDLCHRWTAAGQRMVFVPGAIVEHRPVLTFLGFGRKFFSYGRGAVMHWRKNGDEGRGASSRLRNALALPFAAFRGLPPWAAARVYLLVQISQVCTAAGVLYELAAGAWRTDYRAAHSRHAGVQA